MGARYQRQVHWSRRIINSIAHNSNVACRNAQFNQLVATRLRHRHIPHTPMHPRGHLRLNKPAQARNKRTSHIPLPAMTMVSKQDRRHARKHPRKKRNTILGIHRHIHPTQPTNPQPPHKLRHRSPNINRILATRVLILHPVAHSASRHIRMARRPKNHLMPRRHQILCNVLQVALTATALGVGGVAPAE
ncbi:hypothetical protein AY499_06005 [Corynebacterium diphtheriae bv. gravis]|nr:hypothetical protein AY499_06005 [Corynebacterium diphtheriae bv. gravis]